MSKPHQTGPLKRAIKLVGGQSALALALKPKHPKIKQSHVWNWLYRDKAGVPAEYCQNIEEATGGQVTRYQLRPDVFGSAPKGNPNDVSRAVRSGNANVHDLGS